MTAHNAANWTIAGGHRPPLQPRSCIEAGGCGITAVVKRGGENDRKQIGVCADCRHKRLIQSDRGSTFYLCNRSITDASFPKYPRLPVIQCSGYEDDTGAQVGS